MRVLVFLFVTFVCAIASAHGVRSAYLDIALQDPTHAIVVLHDPVPQAPLELAPPKGCTLTSAAETTYALECPNGIRGVEIEVRGMGPIVSETSVVVSEGSAQTSHLLSASEPRWTIPNEESGVLARYARLGFVHIATGIDHLLFLLGLVLVVRRVRAVLIAETAFTLSHTLSLGATALGWIHVSSRAAEACIALSLVLVALDIGRPTALVGRKPFAAAAIAFVFGLVHGLGFAGGLRELGLPDRAIASALSGFACGIEIGQLAFLACVLAVVHFLPRRVFLERTLAYAIGSVGAFWLFQRLL